MFFFFNLFFFKQKTAYEMRISDWSSDVCSSDLIAGEVKPGDGSGVTFDASKRVDHKIQRQVDPFIVYGIDAAGQAIEDAGLLDMTEEERLRAGSSIGSGIGGLPGIESESIRSEEHTMNSSH